MMCFTVCDRISFNDLTETLHEWVIRHYLNDVPESFRNFSLYLMTSVLTEFSASPHSWIFNDKIAILENFEKCHKPAKTAEIRPTEEDIHDRL